MRKVRWIRLVFVCACITVVTFSWDDLKVRAQSGPSSLPLLTQGGLQYLGGFRVPAEPMNGVDFSYGGSPVAFNPANNSLFVGNSGWVAEITIPTPVNTGDAKAMPAASYVQQAFVDPTEGHMRDVSSSDVVLYGLLIHSNRLIGAASIYYDATYSQRLSHFSRSLSLTQPSFSGWSQVWETGGSGFVGGWMAAVPTEWQAALGGPAITGQCCIPIVTRTSYGPAAFAFDPANVGQPTVGATPLLYYTSEHATLGSWEGQNENYGMTARVGGMAIISGTRTALFVGSNGLGAACYGEGTADKAAADASLTDELCYDPEDHSKGVHAYPYRYQAWAYDLNDFAAVKAGAKQPWDVRPYGVWPLALPTTAPQFVIGGVGYDAQRQILYVSQRHGNQGQFTVSPVIHAFKLTATPAEAPAIANAVGSVSLTADKTAPQTVATPVTFTAQPTGGLAPYQYKWLISDGVNSTFLTGWTASNQYTWTPTSGNPNYRVGVWVRSAGNIGDTAEASTSLPFAISAVAQTSSVTLTANRVAPQAPFTAITWSAVPVGGVAPHQYKWLVSDGTTSTVAANWSPISSFVWTPSSDNANYRVSVWVRSAASTADAQEASATVAFPIESITADSTPVSSVAISANKTAPQLTGTAITWTAQPTGGTGSYLYKWWVFDGSTWTTVANWSGSSTFVWAPTAANSNYRIRVWVKDASNPADQFEASAEKGFAITAPQVTPPPTTTPPATSVARVAGVTLTSDKRSPQPAGTTVNFTARAVGGVGPYQYQWWLFDGDQWSAATAWGTFSSYSWARSTSGPKYQVQVRARSAGSTNDTGEATATVPFVLTNGKGNGKD